jgi:invasion protein IalB
MSLKFFGSAFVAGSFAIFAVTIASAQDLPPAVPATEEAGPVAAPDAPAAVTQPAVDPNLALNELHGDWSVRCFRLESPAPCDIIQFGTNPATQQRVLLISIAYLPYAGAYAAQIIVPLGVTLSRGLSLEAGDGSLNGIKFARCERDGCYVEIAIPDDTITALAARTENTKLSMFAYGQGDVLEMPFSVNGFAEALSRMRDEAVDRAVAPAAE